MLAETKDARLQLYAIATRMESGPQEWTPADTAALRRAANVLNDTSMRLWLSSLFGLSYEME
jgi:hypothetical protein